MRQFIIFLIFFCSGASGLIYQVIWMRKLSLILGVTSEAISTVLAVFMGGLALGSWLLGRTGDKTRSPLRLYGYLEIGIALLGFLSIPILDRMGEIYISVQKSGTIPIFGLPILRFLLISAGLLGPTTLMGGTLPVLLRGVCQTRERIARSSGLLYGINTLGAVVGTLFAAFFLIEAVGIRHSIHVAAAINALLGFSALGLARGQLFTESAPQACHEPENLNPASQRELRAVLLAFGLSGFMALAYEVLWTRYLIYVIGENSVYAFSIMLAAFLLGIVLGSLLASWLGDRIKNLVALFGCIEILIGAAAFITVALIGYLSQARAAATYFFWSESLFRFAKCLAILIVPTTLSGSTFVIVTRIYARHVKSLGQDSGSVYAVNTVGAIFGAIAGGYFFLPYLKLQGGLIALGVGNILVGLWILLRKNPDGRRQIKLAISCALVALCSLTAILWGQDPVKKALIKGNQTLEFYEDGPVSSIAIVRNKSTGALDLFVDGDGQAGTAISSQIHLRLLGSLPALLHPAPKQVLCIAFGAGVTAGCLVQHPVEHMDVVELSRSVIRGSPLFAPFNHDPLNDPRVKLINDDGRNFLLASNKTYDVITVDPIDPDDAGVTSLYSQEFYALVRAHLNEGGITCQWMTTHYDTAEYQMLVRTFQAVFPHSSIWQADTTSVLIGMKDGPRATMADLAARFQYPPVQKSLAVIGISSLADLLSLHFAGPAETRAFVGEGPLNTDDHPLIEYRGPRYTFNGRLFTIEESIWKPLMSLRQPDLHDCVTNWSAEDQNLIRPAYQWMSWIMERRILQSESHQEAIVPRKRSKSEENTRYLAKVDERERRERKILDLTWDLLGSPLSTIQLLMLHLGKQIEASEMLAQQFPPYKDALIRAQDAWQQQNFAEARRLFQEAAGLIPGELRASLMGVACLDRQGDIGGALKEILLLAPATPGASPIRSLAQSLVESLLASMAQPSADKAALGSLLIRVTPNDADRLFNRTQAAYNPRPTEKNVADVNAWRLWFRDAAPQLAIAPGKFIWQNNAR